MKYLILVLMLISGVANAGIRRPKSITLDKSRTINIKGAIRSLDKESAQVLDWSKGSRKPIYFLIDSPGGSVIGGLYLIRAMERAKARGVPLICVVNNRAMSMGTHILSTCHVRYALPTSLIMWHPATITGFLRLDEKAAEDLAEQLNLITAYLESNLRKALNLDRKVYDRYYRAEHQMLAEHLNKLSPRFIRIIHDFR